MPEPKVKGGERQLEAIRYAWVDAVDEAEDSILRTAQHDIRAVFAALQASREETRRLRERIEKYRDEQVDPIGYETAKEILALFASPAPDRPEGEA